jgi:hypothetical protein
MAVLESEAQASLADDPAWITTILELFLFSVICAAAAEVFGLRKIVEIQGKLKYLYYIYAGDYTLEDLTEAVKLPSEDVRL